MENYECRGIWWLPDQEGSSVAGTLDIATDGEIRLSLIGHLGAANDNDPNKSHRIVLGYADDSPCGRAVTLTGCVMTGVVEGTVPGGREEYRASLGYFGAHLESETDFAFRSFLIELSGLSEWASPLSGLNREPAPFPASKYEGQTIPIATYRVPHRPVGQVPGGKVTLNMGLSSRSESQAFSFREKANFLIDLEMPRSASQINGEYVYPLQNLMTFVSDCPQKVERLSFWRSEDHADWERNPEIRVIGPRVQPNDGDDNHKPIRSNQMIFTLADVDFSTFVNRWVRLSEKFPEAFNIFFGLQYGPPAFVDLTFALIAQVASVYYSGTSEGIVHQEQEEAQLRNLLPSLTVQQAEWLLSHVGVRPNPPFQSILRRLVERHGATLDPILLKRRDAFVNQATNTLQFIERRNAEDQLAASHGSELYWLMQKLRFLIKACFLEELGFRSEQIAAIFHRNAYFQHIRKIETSREQNRVQQSSLTGNSS